MVSAQYSPVHFNSLRGYSMYLIHHNQSGPSLHILNTLLANIRAHDDEDDDLDDEDEDTDQDDSDQYSTLSDIYDEDDPNDAFERALDDSLKE